MNYRLKLQLAVACVAALVASTGQVQAATITVEPHTTTDTNSWPTSSTPQRWQHSYDDSFFGSAPLTINSFGFRGAESGSISYGAEFVVKMSTTSVEPGSMSQTYASNVGGDEKTVISGPFTMSATAGVFSVFTLSTPFAYNPSLGNLLIEISHDAATAGSEFFWDAYDPTPTGLQRMAQDTSSTLSRQAPDFGFGELPTRFNEEPTTQNPVPEPASIALFGIGTIGLIGFHRRKVKRTAS